MTDILSELGNGMSSREMYELIIRKILSGKNTVIYTPIDPTTNKIPQKILNKYPSKKIKENVILSYSPNIHRMYLEKGKIPILFVNYSIVLDYHYYGKSKPPERPLEYQIEDWKNGYMWGRTPIPNSEYPESKIKQIEKELGEPILTGWYWVKYHARLVTLPKEIAEIERGIIKVTYVRPLTIKTIIKSIIEDPYTYFTNEKKNITQNLNSLLSSIGFTIDNELEYEIDGKKYRGIQIFLSNDNKYYIVYVPIVRKPEAQIIQLAPLIVIALIIIAISFAVGEYFITKAEIISATEKTKREEIALNFLAEHPEYANNPEVAKEVLNTMLELNKDPSGNSLLPSEDTLLNYVKWGSIGILGLVGGIILLTLLRYLPEPKR